MEYTHEKKKELRDAIEQIQLQSGLSANRFSVERLGFTNGSKFNHVLNRWDKKGVVGIETWEKIENYINFSKQLKHEHKIVVTQNLIDVWETCERAYQLKKFCPIIGEGGTGKTTGLESYKKHIEQTNRFKVFYFNTAYCKTNKQFVVGLMQTLNCFKIGTIADQLVVIRKHLERQNALLIIDEISALKAGNIVVIKDLMSALKDVCGIAFAGTPYFMNLLNNGAAKDKHLFSETLDRLFMFPTILRQANNDEAEQILKANGIEGEALEIAMGRINENCLIKFYWNNKNSFRGVEDCIAVMKWASAGNNILPIKLGQVI